MTINELKRVKCFKSFEFFTRYFFKERHKRKFVVGEHHKIIFEAVNKVIEGKTKRLIINIAPRYSKTELVVKNFIAYSLALNPKSKFIHLSYSDQLALDNSEEVKDLVTSEEYQELFPYVQIKKDSKAKNKWYTTEGGGVLARSASGQVTGFGAGAVDDEDEFLKEGDSPKFSGAIIIDDPLKPDDADSDTIREKVNNKFETTIRNRVNSRNTPIIVIMQRLNENDLCGYLMENEPDEWEVISLPVIKEDGEALWPFKHTIEELHKLRSINEFVFDTQYMQNPKPKEGLLFGKDELNWYVSTELKHDNKIATIGALDPAGDGTDYTSAPLSYLLPNGKIYIQDVVFTPDGMETSIDKVATFFNGYNPEYIRLETNTGGKAYKMLFDDKINDSISVNYFRSTTNKHSRITTMAGFIKKHFVFRLDYDIDSEYGKFIKQLTSYLKNGKSAHDDAADSLEMLAILIRRFYPELYEND